MRTDFPLTFSHRRTFNEVEFFFPYNVPTNLVAAIFSVLISSFS